MMTSILKNPSAEAMGLFSQLGESEDRRWCRLCNSPAFDLLFR